MVKQFWVIFFPHIFLFKIVTGIVSIFWMSEWLVSYEYLSCFNQEKLLKNEKHINMDLLQL